MLPRLRRWLLRLRRWPLRQRRWWIKRRVRRVLARDDAPAAKFALIHRLNYWGNAESRSGNGSSLGSTEVFRGQFETLLRARAISRLFDAPCGDFHWMREVRLPPGCTYLGGDIVPALIADNTARHGGIGTGFTPFNLITDPFPAADLWLCRDCLIHLANADIARVLDNFRASAIPWMLVTSHPHISENRDIATGQYRDVNLRLPPFSLPEPVETLLDQPVGEVARVLGLWHRDQMAGK